MSPMRLHAILFAMFWITAANAQPWQGLMLNSPQASEAPAADPQEHLPTRDDRQAAIASQLRIAMLQEEAAESPANLPAANAAADESEIELLKQIEVTIAQQKTMATSLNDLQTKQTELEQELSRLMTGTVEDGPPFSIILLDQLNDSVASNKAKQEAREGSLIAARESVERAHLILETEKKNKRQLADSENVDDQAKTEIAQRKVQLAEETLVLRRQELAIEEAGEQIWKLTTDLDEAKLEIVKSGVIFSRQTLIEKTAELDVRESELKRKAELIQSEQQYAERRWLTARQELDSTVSPPVGLVQRVESLKTIQQTIQIEQSVVNQRLQRLPMMRAAWERRYLVASNQATRQERYQWLEDTKTQLEQLDREKRSRELKLSEARETLASISAKSDDLQPEDQAMKRWTESTYQSLAKQVELFNSSILGIESASRALTRLEIEIEGTPSRSLAEWWEDSWAAIKRLWNYELAAIDDTSLTVGKCLSSLLFLIFGYFAAHWLSSLLGRRLPNLGVDEAGAHAMESLSFYVLLMGFGLAALKYAHVPLTVFTFLGGAIAIGVGFGSQNILNNFISGLILLAERPIKAGDLIQVGDTYGNVKSIGARSTTIRTGENQDIIVPNSKFLENEVTNLTRRDDRLRTSISVGVAYGSPLEEVIRLLELAAAESSQVDERPKPFVWFNDFGDNALAFQLHFWIRAKSVSAMRKAETEVRLNVDRHFRENGISIAFPQRDLHLSSEAPIEFKMVRDQA